MRSASVPDACVVMWRPEVSNAISLGSGLQKNKIKTSIRKIQKNNSEQQQQKKGPSSDSTWRG